MRAIWRRVAALEKCRNRDDSTPKVTLRFAHLHSLPHTYTGERHERLIRRFPCIEPDGDCVIQEYPGPRPRLNFGFAPGTMLLSFIESDGNGHPKGYWPEEIEAGNRCR